MNVKLTPSEIDAALWAISCHADANANDISVMQSEGMSAKQAKHLIEVQRKLKELRNEDPQR